MGVETKLLTTGVATTVDPIPFLASTFYWNRDLWKKSEHCFKRSGEYDKFRAVEERVIRYIAQIGPSNIPKPRRAGNYTPPPRTDLERLYKLDPPAGNQ